MIGILGGTFDPIHYGHLRTALDVQQVLDLDEIRLVPLRDPPHRKAPLTTPQQRLGMIHSAVRGISQFRVDERELRRCGKSYTLDTLRSLRRELRGQVLCLLLGEDAFQDFPNWHCPEGILERAHLVVMTRPGATPPGHYPDRIVQKPERLFERSAGLILTQAVTSLGISATAIRRMIQRGVSPRFLLPDPVLDYIEAHGLYRPDPTLQQRREQ